MMKWVLRISALVLLAAVGIWVRHYLFPNAEQKIRKQLEGLARSASFSGQPSGLTPLNYAVKLGSFCTADVQILVDAPGLSSVSLSGRDELQAHAAGARNQLSSLQIDFIDLVIQLAPGGTNAVVNVTTKARIANERDEIVQELKLALVSRDGDWLIDRVETVKTLR
jgi:hypothetical protein